MCPTVAKWRCDISTHGLHSHLQMAITFPFLIQIKHRLKLWTPDLPSFETKYCMHNLNFRKWSNCVQQLSKWGCGCEIGIFHFLGLRSHFAATKWGSLCCEMALVCQNRLRNCEIPCRMGLLVRNQVLALRNAFRSCETDAPVLRSSTRVPKLVLQLRNFSQRSQLSCELVS